MDSNEIWNRFLHSVRSELGEAICELWFSAIRLVSLKDSQATVEVPNLYIKEWVTEHYPDLIQRILSDIVGSHLHLTLTISENTYKEVRNLDEKTGRRQQYHARRGKLLNPKYTFDNFVTGESNKLARAAATKVAEAPGHAYNPLFIYGGVGLGKTHLLSAIGNEIYSKYQGLKIHYVPVVQFTEEVVSAIRKNSTDQLKEKYRALDVLLIDDVQFIGGKPATENELFHTFNLLYEGQKQIVLTSDRPPKEISSITDRLRSRFGMGLTIDIRIPEIETKLEIIRRRIQADRLRIPDDVAYYLATHMNTNIRDLEGCIIRLGVNYSLTGIPVDLDIAKNLLKDLIGDSDRPLTIEGVIKDVAEFYNLAPTDLKAKKRTRDVALPRQVAMYMARECTGAALSEIGNALGGRDHATIIYACNQINKRRKDDENFNRMMENLKGMLKGAN